MKITYTECKGQPCVLAGIPHTLHEWLQKHAANSDSWLRETLLLNEGIGQYTLALGLRDPYDRRNACLRLANQVWTRTGELGGYPLICELADSEEDRRYFPGYRDHASHQFLVMLLGFWLVDQHGDLRDAVVAEAGSEERFIRRWLVASLSHDIGYLQESKDLNTDITPEDGAFTDLARKIRDKLNWPLSHAGLMPFTKEEGFDNYTQGKRNRLEGHTFLFSSESIWTRVTDPRKSLKGFKCPAVSKYLDDFSTKRVRMACARRHLAGRALAIRLYFERLAGENGHNRGRYRDHGVVSFLLVWLFWSRFRIVLTEVAANKGCGAFFGTERATQLRLLKERVANPPKGLSEVAEDVLEGGLASAFHNVRLPGNLANADLEAFLPDQFGIWLRTEDTSGDHEAVPLLFLLRLADSIQDWGRIRFQRPGTEERLPSDTQSRFSDLRQDHDMSIRADGGKILLYVRGKDGTANCFEEFAKKEFVHLVGWQDIIESDEDESGVLEPSYPARRGSSTHSASPSTPADGRRGDAAGTPAPEDAAITGCQETWEDYLGGFGIDETGLTERLRRYATFLGKEALGKKEPVPPGYISCCNPRVPEAQRTACALQLKCKHLLAEMWSSAKAVHETGFLMRVARDLQVQLGSIQQALGNIAKTEDKAELDRVLFVIMSEPLEHVRRSYLDFCSNMQGIGLPRPDDTTDKAIIAQIVEMVRRRYFRPDLNQCIAMFEKMLEYEEVDTRRGSESGCGTRAISRVAQSLANEILLDIRLWSSFEKELAFSYSYLTCGLWDDLQSSARLKDSGFSDDYLRVCNVIDSIPQLNKESACTWREGEHEPVLANRRGSGS